MLLFLVAILVYVPPIQNWVVNKVADEATKGTGLTVTVQRVGLSFPLDLDVRGVVATDAVQDTLLNVHQVIADLDLSQIFKMQIGVDNICLNQGFVDTKTLIAGLAVRGRIGCFQVQAPRGIDLSNRCATLRDISLSDCDITAYIGDMPADTTASEPIDWKINIHNVDIRDVHAVVQTDSMNVEMRLRNSDITQIGADLGTGDYQLEHLQTAIDYVIVGQTNLPAFTFTIDSTHINSQNARIAQARLDMSESWIELKGEGDFRGEQFELSIDGTVAKAQVDSIKNILGNIIGDMTGWGGDGGINMALRAYGSMQHIIVPTAHISWDKVATIDATAEVHNPIEENLQAKLNANISSFAGGATLKASYDNQYQSYQAEASLRNFAPNRIMADIPVSALTMAAAVQGQGMDFLSKKTSMHADMDVSNICIDSLSFSDITMSANLEAGRLKALLTAADSLVKATAQLEGFLRDSDRRKNGQVAEATLGIDLRRIDLHGLHLTDSLLSVGGCIHIDAITNLTDRYHLTGSVHDILLMRPDTVLRPVDLEMDVMLHPDSLYAMFSAGQMYIQGATQCGWTDLVSQIDVLGNEFVQQAEQYFIETEVIRPLLPKADMHIHICGRNPVSTYMQMLGYTFDDIRFDLNSDPDIGLNGGGHIHTLNTGVAIIDTVRWNIFQDSTGINIKSQIHNGLRNKQFVFDAHCDIMVIGNGAGVNITYTDGKGRRGVDVGAVANLTNEGVKLHLTPHNPIIAYRQFTLNKDNYAFLTNAGSILANIDLLADDGTGMQLYSAHQLSDSLALDSLGGEQDITVSLHDVNLRELTGVLPYMPSLGGQLGGDVHYIEHDSLRSVFMDANIKRFAYEESPIGNIGANVVYMPDSAGRHTVDGILSLNDQECVNYSGWYITDGIDDFVDVKANLIDFPLSVANGFVEKNLAQVGGTLNGGLQLTGTIENPIVNGELLLNNVNIVSNDYSLKLRVEDDTISVEDNYLDFKRIDIYSKGRNPLTMNGYVDFRELDNINLDLSLTSHNFELINAKKNSRALAYGKVFCDVDAYLRGTLSNMLLGGTLKVLGNTDVTYVLRDSPLTVEDRLGSLVTFVDFSNDDAQTEEELARMDMRMNMKLLVDDAAQVHCLLSEDKSSYVDIEGGGELLMTYSPDTELSLNGRYTINSGEMKYQLPIIPLKTFHFDNGSYIAFNGKILNPTLNISAKERMKAQVSEEGGASRSVAFDVGVKITQTLEKMGLQFTIDAPEDATVQNDLETMDEATRGRLAVTMLATGMYLSESNTGGSGFSTENALNAFLQSEISNIAGKALSTVDVTFGVENNTTATGATQTDYTFRFAKHFWGNRISVILGGVVSSGSEAQNDGTTLVDNVSIEYRLDQSATRYVRVFYDKTYESLMDGKLTEMGAGLVLRRKTTNLGDLFIFRRKKK